MAKLTGSPYDPLPMGDSDLPSAFGKAVRELRSARGWSQEHFATRAEIDRSYMDTLERGERNPSLTTIANVARGLEMSMSEVMKAVESLSVPSNRRSRRRSQAG